MNPPLMMRKWWVSLTVKMLALWKWTLYEMCPLSFVSNPNSSPYLITRLYLFMQGAAFLHENVRHCLFERPFETCLVSKDYLFQAQTSRGTFTTGPIEKKGCQHKHVSNSGKMKNEIIFGKYRVNIGSLEKETTWKDHCAFMLCECKCSPVSWQNMQHRAFALLRFMNTEIK